MLTFLNGVNDAFHAHPYALIVMMWVFTAAVTSLPSPGKDSSPFYQWFFGFTTILAGALKRVMSNSVENSPNFLPAAEIHRVNTQNAATVKMLDDAAEPGAVTVVGVVKPNV